MGPFGSELIQLGRSLRKKTGFLFNTLLSIPLNVKFGYLVPFQGVGFSKEYEEIRADSCLDEYAAQDSQHPENVDRNRYPNIVACK